MTNWIDTKECLAVGCDRKVPDNLFMCYAHWERVPRRIQKDIRFTLASGRTKAHERALAAAVEAVKNSYCL